MPPRRHPRPFGLLLPLAAAFAVAGCRAADLVPPGAGKASSPEGVYAMAPPLRSELRVVALPGRSGEYRVEIHGVGDPALGAGTGADCLAVAEGPLVQGRIDAVLLPFASDTGGLDAIDLADAPRLQLGFGPDAATVQGEFAHCAMATAMAGRYRRTTTPRLLVDCAPLPRVCWNRD